MKKILFLGVLTIIILTISCKRNCPDDVNIGSITFTEQSRNFFPYKENQELVFISNTGEKLRFISKDGGVHITNHMISVYKICTEFRYDGQSSYKYFESKYMNAVYFSENPNLSFNISLFTDILHPEKELFYDKLIVDVMAEGSIGRGEIITDIRFTEPYQEDEFNIQFPMELVDEVTLNDATYTDVYKSELFDKAQIFYNKEQGLIGFTTHDLKTYNLDRIE